MGSPETSLPVIVIPAYQAAATVGGVVRGARASGLKVCVVDDGSSDGSGERAEEAGAAVLRHPENRGKGAALQSGFAWAERRGASAVVTLDADGQHDPGEITLLVAAHEASPRAVVIGVRSFDESMPRRSRVGNRISTWWIARFARQPYRDTQSGFRVYPRALWRSGPLRTSRFDTETELLLVASKLGLPLVQVPVRTIYHGDKPATHYRNVRDTLRIIRLVVGSPWWRVQPALDP
jgi:glycosyltransferase involved in cell wall biosynthesis